MQQRKDARSKSKGALTGVKVLEWAHFVAGPYCAKFLADNGAEVIKVEEPEMGDESRRRGAFPNDIPHPERSALFLYLNTNKKGVTLNLNTVTGKEVFERLIKEVDIFIEDNPPHLMHELGLDYRNLKAINPQIIMTSITPFGQTGPYKDYKAYYLNTFHSSGFGYLTPSDPFNPRIVEREPIMMGGFLAEYYSGVHATVATMAALYARRMLGIGQCIDVSKQETQFVAQKTDMANYCDDGQVLNRASTLGLGAHSWGGTIPCKDGYVNMMGAQPDQVAAIFDLMGNPEWSKEEKFSPEQFHLHSMEMRPHVLSWAAEHNKEEIFHGGQQRRVPLAAVYTVEEAMNTEHLKEREFFVEIDHPKAGRLAYPSATYRFSRTPVRFERPAPMLGEHNREVYCEQLGYSQEDLVQMRRTGVI